MLNSSSPSPSSGPGNSRAWHMLVALAFAASAGACTIESNQGLGPNGIPQDPGGSLPETKLNNVKPGASFGAPVAPGAPVRVNLLGLLDPATQQPLVFRAQDSVFLAEDGVLKGLRVTQSSSSNNLPFDLTFVVDNSGSMSEEADGIANKIVEFVGLVAKSGADLRVAVVGYSGEVRGAMNFGDAAAVEAYLKRPSKTGTNRTVGFGGPDAETLGTKAKEQKASGRATSSENGIVGIQFAETALSFRPGAQRIFVNFTDEPTQPEAKLPLASKTLCERWKPEHGTIHTVWSGGELAKQKWTELRDENPADLSRCTPGGVVKEIKSNASDLDLTTLPFTDALRNSALVEFNSANAGAAHTVEIVVKSPGADGRVRFVDVKYAP